MDESDAIHGGNTLVSIFNRPTRDATGSEKTNRELDRWNTTDSPAADVIFDVLRNERRRHVLLYLHAADGAVEMNELAEMLAQRESDDGTYDHRDRKRMYIALHQNHLPRMDDVGIVDYDTRSKHVRPGTEFDRVLPYLSGNWDTPVRWNRLYLVGGLLSVGIVVPGYLWLTPRAVIPAEFWVGMLVGVSCSLICIYLVSSTKWINAEWFRA